MATPIYLEQWFGVVILLGWIAITLGPAAVLFERGDLT